MISRMPGAAVFLMPNVVEELAITDKQQKKIQDIITATSAAIAELESQMNIESGQISETVYQELLGIARNSALQLLTEEQRSRWQQLSAEKSRDKSAQNKE